MCEERSEDRLISLRYLLLGVFGSGIGLFGLIANALLATLFLGRSHYRHSPFFFLGFVALFDTLVDLSFVLTLSVPVTAEFYSRMTVYLLWLEFMPALYLLLQIFKIASVFCLIMASIERYCMTKHWTFTGFERRTRWFVLAILLVLSIIVKNITYDVIIEPRPECSSFRRWHIGTNRENAYQYGLLNTFAIFIPFFTLVFLNGGIVLMLRKQNVQQLRSLITELTMGHDVMKIRRRNLRAATNTLLVIISVYIFSNLLTLFIIITEFFDSDFLHVSHPDFYRIASDSASLMVVIGNAIRCPAHYLSNSEIRQQFYMLFYTESDHKSSTIHRSSIDLRRRCALMLHVPDVECVRRKSERLETPWISLLLSVHEKDQPQSPLLARNYTKRHSTIAIC